MTRSGVLRAGYVALGLAFLALAGASVAGSLLIPGLLLAFAGAIVLLFSQDDLPKWAGITLLAYYALLVLAFLAATPITIRKGGAFGFEPLAPDLAADVEYYLGLVFPLMLTATSLAAAWERERPVRYLLLAAALGFVLVAILTVVQRPGGATSTDVARAAAQGSLLAALIGLSALAGAAGTFWSAARPEELG